MTPGGRMTPHVADSLRRIANELRELTRETTTLPTPKSPEVGQLVRRVRRSNGGPPVGAIGVMRSLDSYGSCLFGIEWAMVRNWPNGDSPNNLTGKLRINSGWYVPADDLELCHPVCPDACSHA